MTVTWQAIPDLRNQDTPDLCLRSSTLRFGRLLVIEHPFGKGNEVQDKMVEGRRVWLGK